jgi:hypothetical protein
MSPVKHGLGRGLGALIPPGQPSAVTSGVKQVPVAAHLAESASAAPQDGCGRVARTCRFDSRTRADSAAHRHARARFDGNWRRAINSSPANAAGARQKLAGLAEVPVIVRGATPQEMLELALVENIQRADLNVLEEANAYRQLMSDFGLTQEQVATKVGKHRATVANALRLLRLGAEAQTALAEDAISEGHARALLTVEDEKATERFVAPSVGGGMVGCGKRKKPRGGLNERPAANGQQSRAPPLVVVHRQNARCRRRRARSKNEFSQRAGDQGAGVSFAQGEARSSSISTRRKSWRQSTPKS